jgi:PAS domain S-box-containing protein
VVVWAWRRGGAGIANIKSGGSMNWLTSFTGSGGLLPHGYCFACSPGLLWTMVGADAAIAIAYFSIPLVIVSFVIKRGIARNNPAAWLFCAFIFACGITHVMDIWTIWSPDYVLQTVAKVVTAVISIATAVALWPLARQALKIPSAQQLQSAIDSLHAEAATHKHTEEHLQNVEQALAVTLGSIGAGFIATDELGRVIRMNAVAEQVTGWPQADAMGLSLWAVFMRDGRPPEIEQRNPLDVMIELGIRADQSQLIVAVARSGLRTEVELNAALTHGPDGTPRGMLLVFRDMTRLNEAEAERRRLAAIVESSNDAIISKTLDGRILSWNEAAETTFGYTAEEALGKSVQMLIPPGRRAEEMRILAELAHGKKVAAFDTVRQAKDGSLVDVSISISPIRDAAGRIVGGAKIARDVTQQRRAEAALRESEARRHTAEEANRLKSQFLANMSHELRTPLNAIIGFADLLHTGAVPFESPKHREFLGHISSSGRHLLQLINDVLDLSKVESGKFEFFPEAVDLPQLVKDVCNVLQPSVQRKRMRVEVDIDPRLGSLMLDAARLKQVLFNYLSNAIKFTPEGGCVSVRARPDGERHFICEVEDTGIGISTQDLSRLFVDFQQLDAGYNRQHQGTGLGLALTRRLVEAQGGSVGVHSTPGVGSVFVVRLRRDTTRTEEPDKSGQRRMLVIEYDQGVQTAMTQAMTSAGFHVDVAASGEEARQHAQSRAYDAITLDLLLPDTGGLGALASIRSEGVNRESPVVAVTVPGDTGDTAAFAIADVLTKPIRTDEIVSAMAPFCRLGSSGVRVMVIDDDLLALDLMRATLDSMGLDVVCMQDGRRALLEIDEHQPDAIILDLMMPDFDGFAVLDALHRIPVWQSTPVFIWSSMLLTDDEYETLARSARAVLSKGGGALQGVLQALSRWRPPMDSARDVEHEGDQV